SIPLVSQNNKEASVSVVNNIPILKSTIQGGSGTARDVIQNIERLDVGIKLKLTPHVNPSNEVCMVLNPSIEAIIDAGTAGQYTPTIAKREVSTTVTVPDGRTIVISGLIREDRSNVVRKIPLLGSIPLIGVLFRHTVESKQRTNLIIFVTPRVMSNDATARGATDLWSRKTGLNTTNAEPAVATPMPADNP
ncbi:MAG: type II and III secretion system protein, partial [bacterium]